MVSASTPRTSGTIRSPIRRSCTHTSRRNLSFKRLSIRLAVEKYVRKHGPQIVVRQMRLQIDGEAVTLAKRLAVAGVRYSGGGITLTIGKTGATTVKHLKRPVTACGVT